MADERYRVKSALLDWENELNYCKSILENDNSSPASKEHARKRIKEAKSWIDEIKSGYSAN